jgi:hypothetical protein
MGKGLRLTDANCVAIRETYMSRDTLCVPR